MGLPFKPHSVTVRAPAQGSVAGRPGAASWSGNGTARSVQITPMKFGTVFNAEGVQVNRPHLLLDDPDGAALYVVNAKVSFGSRTFYVIGPSETFDGIIVPASHCSVIISEDK
ncbi:MAG: hypothetical protein JNK63_02470 [Chthonomonas sp.]|nr:hypothetical protein [Chthonomonas sp.]